MKLKDLKKGAYFFFKGDYSTVYVRGSYIHTLKEYSCHPLFGEYREVFFNSETPCCLVTIKF